MYYPNSPSGSGRTPVLVWVYGGGFDSGERQLPPPTDLGYACVGSYFAKRGFITVIPDYRLVPNVLSPGQAEDVRDAIVWCIKHPEHLTTPSNPSPDVQNVYLMGHSAGGSNAFTAVILPETPDTAILRSSIAGMILCAGVYHFSPLPSEDPFWNVAAQYCGGLKEIEENTTTALFSRASDSTIASLPRVLAVEGEREPNWLAAVGKEFRQVFEARTGKRLEMIVAKGHNHVSLNWALGTGEGEEWAEEVLKWINESK